jgi:hypothetical protein
VIPQEGTLITAPSTSDIYLIHDRQRAPLMNGMFQNLGYKQKDIIRLTSDVEFASIPIGSPAPPKDGTYFSISGSRETYLYKSGAKHLISAFVVKQRRIVPDFFFDASVVSYWPDGIAVTPVDGTVVKSDASSTVYVVMKGQLRQLNAALLMNLNITSKQIMTLPDVEFGILPKGGFAMPKEQTYFNVGGTGEFYLYASGVKRRIYPFVAKQKNITPDFTFTKEMSDSWPLGKPIVPREGTLLRSSVNGTTYLLSQGKLRSMTAAVFKRRGYATKNVKIISRTELDDFELGTPLKK